MGNSGQPVKAQGKGSSRGEAIRNALCKLGMANLSDAETRVEVVQEGVYGFFGGCRKPWIIEVTNVRAQRERDEEQKRREEEREKREEERKKHREEQERRRPWDAFLEVKRCGQFRKDKGLSDEESLQELQDSARTRVKRLYEFRYPNGACFKVDSASSAVKDGMLDVGWEYVVVPVLAGVERLRDEDLRSEASQALAKMAIEEPQNAVFYALLLHGMHRLAALAEAYERAGRNPEAAETWVAANDFGAAGKVYERELLFNEAALCYERGRQYGDALRLLQTVGHAAFVTRWDKDTRLPQQWPSPDEQRAAYEAKRRYLQGLAKAAGQGAQEQNLVEIEERYAYGEITKQEYERMKASLSLAGRASCPACHKPLMGDFAFCPHCGAKQ